MPVHGNAAVSHGNAWLQTLKQPILWIWDGLVAEDAITLLSAPEKTGKTTLLSLLLDRRRRARRSTNCAWLVLGPLGSCCCIRRAPPADGTASAAR